VAEKLGIHYVYAAYCPIVLPSPHHPPPPLPGRPYPPDVTDNRVLNDLNAQSFNALFGEALNTHRAAAGLPPVDNVRDYVFTGHPWLAAGPALTPQTRARATAVAGTIRAAQPASAGPPAQIRSKAAKASAGERPTAARVLAFSWR
jgi:vancomycin aglycone glucosyltransferase